MDLEATAKLSSVMSDAFLNLHALLFANGVGFAVTLIKSAAKQLGWDKKKAWIVFLPMVPELLAIGGAFIPGVAPEAIATPALKIGWGIVIGMAASKVFKIVRVWFEKVDPGAKAVPVGVPTQNDSTPPPPAE